MTDEAVLGITPEMNSASHQFELRDPAEYSPLIRHFNPHALRIRDGELRPAHGILNTSCRADGSFRIRVTDVH